MIILNRRIGISQMYNLGFQHYQSYFMFDLSKKEAKLISQGITQDNRKDLIYTSEENDNIAKSFIIPDKSFNLTKDQCNQIELEYEKFGYDSDDNQGNLEFKRYFYQ